MEDREDRWRVAIRPVVVPGLVVGLLAWLAVVVWLLLQVLAASWQVFVSVAVH